MLGDELVKGMQIVNHDAPDVESLTWCDTMPFVFATAGIAL